MQTVKYPIEQWKAQAKPYCLIFRPKHADRTKPYGSKRYATPQEALAAARRIKKHFLLIDYAGAYDAA